MFIAPVPPVIVERAHQQLPDLQAQEAETLYMVIGYTETGFLDNKHTLIGVYHSLADAQKAADNAKLTLADDVMYISILKMENTIPAYKGKPVVKPEHKGSPVPLYHTEPFNEPLKPEVK